MKAIKFLKEQWAVMLAVIIITGLLAGIGYINMRFEIYKRKQAIKEAIQESKH